MKYELTAYDIFLVWVLWRASRGYGRGYRIGAHGACAMNIDVTAWLWAVAASLAVWVLLVEACVQAVRTLG